MGDARSLADAVAALITVDRRIPGPDAQAVMTAYDLPSPDAILCAALPLAAAGADAPISGYRVGAVGVEAGTGDVLLAANLEFPGADLTRTVHAEGAIAIRTFLRGTSVATLAIGEARPCAFCRQTLVEFPWSRALRLIDPHGNDRSLAELYPWPFEPEALGMPGAAPDAVPWPDLWLDDAAVVPADVALALETAGRRAHAPYSACPAAVVLRLDDGRLVAGMTLESVSFDPTTGPLAVALVALRAGGDGYAGIDAAWLAHRVDGPVDDTAPTRALLAAVAPDAPLTLVPWDPRSLAP
jgi:cytidine deaminase